MISEEEILLREAAADAAEKVAEFANAVDLSVERVFNRLVEALDATMIEPIALTIYEDGEPKRQDICYTKRLLAWGPWLKAIEIGVQILGLVPNLTALTISVCTPPTLTTWVRNEI